MKILIGADIVPTPSNYDLFYQGNVNELIGEDLVNVFSEADFKVFNLETPLADRETPIKKSGPALMAPTKTANGLSSLGINLLTLANNHIMDQGKRGLESTLDTLKHFQIDTVGVGENSLEASTVYFTELKGRKIGFYACVDHEFSVATSERAGANPFDSLKIFSDIKKASNQCDYLIVLYHGGKEEYRYPSPRLQEVCHSLVDSGANLVICQHSHCIGCEENYHDSKIIYGQGNFIFDLDDNEFWNTSLLIELDENFNISYIPVVKTNELVRKANSQEAHQILDDFFKRSEEIKDVNVIKSIYQEYAKKQFQHYLIRLQGGESLLFRLLNKLSGNKLREKYLNRKYNAKVLMTLLNYFECETHQELIIEGIKTKIGD
ncbi:CapA family protein [Streptococcus sp. S784/96/1]|uniref:CapA family protein n=1 Tax=Streptococcus sp. S784/96/1 TaxID=2653499 RepID=UPI00138A1B32|nr:CapA family protein [Streptococcus sp. S784/96/1]